MARRAQLLEIDSDNPQPHRIGQCVSRIEQGQVVIVPTDDLYGLVGDIENRKVMEQLYLIRQLDRTKPLSILLPSLSEAARYGVIDDDCYRVMRRVCPGPYTFLMSATQQVPKSLTQKKRRTVGIRIPGHPVIQALLEALGRPLLTTTAVDEEDAGGLSDPVRLAEQYGHGVGLVLDAGILLGEPTTVVDWTGDSPDVVRVGAGDPAAIESGRN